MSLRKTLGFFVVLAVFHLWLTSPWLQAGTAFDTLYEKAKQEGEVMVWSPTEYFSRMAGVFEKRFPGIRVKFFELEAIESVQRVILEAQAGRTSTDVIQVPLKDGMMLIDRNLLARPDWVKLFGNLGVTKDNLMLDGYALNLYHLDIPVMINTNLVSQKEIPRSWEDVLNPKWKGKILLEQRVREWGYLAIRWSDEQLREFGKKLKQQNPHFLRGGTSVTQQLAAGDAALGSGGYGYQILELQKKGAPVDFSLVSPIGVGTRGLTVLRNALHPAAAQLFVAWISSPEGQQELEAGTGQGSLAPGSPLKLAKIYRDKGIELLFEAKDNIDRIEKGVIIMREVLGIK